MIIPSFAVGRTQELLYFIREIKDGHMVKSNPDFPVYIDSPLAKKATTIFTGDLHGYLDEDAIQLVSGGTHMFSFPGLRMAVFNIVLWNKAVIFNPLFRKEVNGIGFLQ